MTLNIELDGMKIRTVADFHYEIARLLDFGPYYGKNLDALWDRVSRDVERPVRVRWTHASVSRQALGEHAFSSIVQILAAAADHDLKTSRRDRFEFELEE